MAAQRRNADTPEVDVRDWPRQDRLRLDQVHTHVPAVLVQGAAENAVIGPRMNVGPAGRVLVVAHLHGQPRIADPHDLAAHRIHRGFVSQLANRRWTGISTSGTRNRSPCA